MPHRSTEQIGWARQANTQARQRRAQETCGSAGTAEPCQNIRAARRKVCIAAPLPTHRGRGSRAENASQSRQSKASRAKGTGKAEAEVMARADKFNGSQQEQQEREHS